MEEKDEKEVDALCPECGNAFKTFVDRLLHDDKDTSAEHALDCPVCGYGECSIGK